MGCDVWRKQPHDADPQRHGAGAVCGAGGTTRREFYGRNAITGNLIVGDRTKLHQRQCDGDCHLRQRQIHEREDGNYNGVFALAERAVYSCKSKMNMLRL